jgi:hypothetical protein
MFREFIARLGDPRLRRPIAGVLLSYLAWVSLLVRVTRLGWTDGSASNRWLAAALPMLPILVLLGMHLERVAAPLQITAMHIWSVGMLAWMLGLMKAFRDHR